MRECSVEGCERKHAGRGYCGTHLARIKTRGTLELIDQSPEARFWRKVDQTGDCWVWSGAVSDKGYGSMGGPDGVTLLVHRFSWEIHYGPIPPGMFVCHRCDNRPCVRPEHLFLGTAKDNTRDMMAKGRNRYVAFSGDDHWKRRRAQPA